MPEGFQSLQIGQRLEHADDGALRDPAGADPFVLVAVAFGIAPEFDIDGPLGPGDFPGVAETQPLVGLLDLPAVDDLLLEDAELVADAVTDGRDLQGGE